MFKKLRNLFKKKKQRAPRQYFPTTKKLWNFMCSQQREIFLKRASIVTNTKTGKYHHKHKWIDLPKKVRTILKNYWKGDWLHKDRSEDILDAVAKV